MTEEEKLELAKKLDEDLDEFIHSRQKSTYTDGIGILCTYTIIVLYLQYISLNK